MIEKQVVSVSPRDRERLRSDPDISAAAPARMRLRLIDPIQKGDPCSIANSSELPTCWGITAIGAELDTYDGAGITVAVLDTGIDQEHPCFKDRGIQLDCKNFTSESDDDEDGHGTHCAGTLFGRDVEGRRIGVARGVRRALIGKVIGKDGGSLESIVNGLDWAAANGAHIISMSLGIDYPGYAVALERAGLPAEIAVSRALADYHDTVTLFQRLQMFVESRSMLASRSVLMVAAAGNESRRAEDASWTVHASPPANATGIVSVGALGVAGNDSYAESSFSNTGCKVLAPGEGIVSASPGGKLSAMSGTSMATPHVAGVAALWGQKRLQERNAFDAESVRVQLLSNCRDLLKPRLSVGGLVQAPR
ncbi:MAG: S8 family serine peptidase [Pyrinomonadaceae bacterium]|nr:S8 family serine peptidase [Phycisphaerales bacterium]